MIRKLGRVLKNIFLVTVPTIVFVILVLEILLRLFVSVSDGSPWSQFNNEYQIVNFEPNKSGTVIRSSYSAEFRSNSDGWLSHREYDAAPEATVITIIGDSYVEAVQVDFNQNMGAVAEALLNNQGFDTEFAVYTFGKSGAPLSQYLNMMRYVEAEFDPDIFVINIVHNDFQESVRAIRNKSQYLQYNIDEVGPIVEEGIVPFNRSTMGEIVYQVTPHSALARYLIYNLQIMSVIESILNPNPTAVSVIDPDIGSDLDPDLIRTITEYTLREFQKVSGEKPLVLIVDAPRRSIYANESPFTSDYYVYNRTLLEVAADLHIDVIDMTDVFLADYTENGQRFDFDKDYHWNVYGHQVVGETLADWVQHIIEN